MSREELVANVQRWERAMERANEEVRANEEAGVRSWGEPWSNREAVRYALRAAQSRLADYDAKQMEEA